MFSCWKHRQTHCSDPLPPVSIKQDKKKAALSGGRHGVENSSFSGQTKQREAQKTLGKCGIVQKNNCLIRGILGLWEFHKHLKSRAFLWETELAVLICWDMQQGVWIISKKICGNFSQLCFPAGPCDPVPSVNVWLNSEGQTWSSCIIPVASCRHFYSSSTSTLWVNLQMVHAFHRV